MNWDINRSSWKRVNRNVLTRMLEKEKLKLTIFLRMPYAHCVKVGSLVDVEICQDMRA